MKKTELIAFISRDTGLNKRDVARVLDSLTSAVMSTLQAGERLSLTGLGTFSSRFRAGRIATNPKTKAPVEISEAYVPRFKPSRVLKEQLCNQGIVTK